jgi:TBC domain-containing protein kinase-like protein
MRLPRVQFLMKRMLCAWVFDSPGRVYWQGLDSLCAVFAVTFVEKEPTAYACMDEFLSRLLPNIFVDDNSEALQERLLRLQQWTGLLDPELAQHFASVGVTPNLYAIPWLMTLFAHIFPLDLLFKVWDVLLGLHQHQHCSAVEGGAEMLPTLFAVCFLSEMRERLLKCNFEQAVAFLTRLPTPLEQIVELALERLPTAFLLVPRSVLRGTTNTSLEAAPAAADDPGKVPSSSSTSKKQPLQTIRFERSARVSPNEILRDPMIEHTLVVDVRSASRFREVHILGSRNFSAAGLQASGIAKACKQIQKVRMALKRKYIAVVGEVVMDAAEMAAALVDDGIAFVLIIDGEFNDVAGNCVASEMIVQGSK